MPYRSQKKRLAAMKRWREKNPGYMAKYYREKVKPLNRPHAPKRLPVAEDIEV